MLELFDVSFEQISPHDPQRSFLFAGIGDARHMYRMFFDIQTHEERGSPRKTYHWTIIDINKYALARDLLVFMLLRDLSGQEDFESDEAILLLTTIFYIFAGSMMPTYAFDKMQQAISKALAVLQAGHHSLDWLYIHEQDLPQYIQALTEWQDTAMKHITNDRFIQCLVEYQKKSEAGQPGYFTRTPQTFKSEQVFYTRSGLLYPPQRMLELHESSLSELIATHAKKPKKNASLFREYTSKKWKINPTLMALDWLKDEGEEIDLNHDPFLLLAAVSTLSLTSHSPSVPRQALISPLGPGASSETSTNMSNRSLLPTDLTAHVRKSHPSILQEFQMHLDYTTRSRHSSVCGQGHEEARRQDPGGGYTWRLHR